ncbi:hypothetical protein ACKWTF_000296 [Chironomus riparius]
MYKLILFLQVIILIGSSISYQSDNVWYCRDDHYCLPLRNNNEQSTVQTFQNQNICRLMCGKFGGLWPKPTLKCNLEKSTVGVNAELIRFEYPQSDDVMREYLNEVSFLFLKNINDECGNICNSPSDTEMFIHLSISELSSLKLTHDTDESYQLNISTSDNKINAHISSNTVFGTRHGLETLAQLMVKIVDDKQRNGLVTVSSAEISDKPYYKHRGLLLDTARHFIPIETILKVLDGMSVNKMNVFHWHITDSQSFPMEITRVPQMHLNGAFSSDKVYSQRQINDIVKYAKYRGIRVIFELDAPAHAGHGWEWGKKEGLGNLAVCVDNQPWRKSCIQPNCGQLNPANDNLYSVLRDIYQDIRDYKEKGEFFHMGGDEVFMACWNNSKEITDYMQSNGYALTTEGFLDLWSEFQRKALDAFDSISDEKIPMVLWSSELTLPNNIDKYLPKNRYIIQTWLPDTSDVPEKLLKKGYRLIMSTKNAWYFDHGFWGITQYYSWKKVYANTLPRHPLVLGGEVCMWSEYCDEHSVEFKIFPRLNAAAERLWTNPATDLKSAEPRFNRQRERIIARGIKTDATIPEYCALFEGECN